MRVSGEQELPLAPLARDDAVTLFVERARAVRPDFQPDEAELAAIAEICGHLDCLPLAIELAATRVKMLSPTAMLARMEHRLELLTSGSRDAPARHRALRDTIGWSVDLLDDDEQALFRRLSVFVGGCTLEAVEEVCGVDLDTLGSLVDKSLVRSDGERFGMLETIREYAGELLDASAEARGHPAGARRALPRLAHAAAAGLATSDQAMWRTTLEADHDNLRAAIRFSLDDGRRGDGTRALRRALALLVRARLPQRGTALARRGARDLGGGIADPRPRAERKRRPLALPGRLRPSRRALPGGARALSRARRPEGRRGGGDGLALVRRTRGDYPEAEALFREALAVYEGLGDEAGDRADARPVRAALRRHRRRRTGPARSSSAASSCSGGSATRRHRARSTASPSRVLRARSPTHRHRSRRASTSCEGGRPPQRREGALVVADINADLGDAETAAAQLEEALTLFVEFGDRWFWVVVLESVGLPGRLVGDAERAVRLFGAADAVSERSGHRSRHGFALVTTASWRRRTPPWERPLRAREGRREAAPDRRDDRARGRRVSRPTRGPQRRGRRRRRG